MLSEGFHWYPLLFRWFRCTMQTSIVPGFAFARRQFGAVLRTGAALPVRIQRMVRRRAPHSSLSGSTSTSGSSAEMSGGAHASEAHPRLRRMANPAHSAAEPLVEEDPDNEL